MSEAPWFREGLCFRCTQCGHCCTGPGSVLVSDDEICALSLRLEMDEDAFRQRYTRELRGGAVSLRTTRTRHCVFFEGGRGCAVHEDRPRQCRTWPFWQSVVYSRESWDAAARECPGMNAGERHELPVIQAFAKNDGTKSPQ